jgi:hypothetical protein
MVEQSIIEHVDQQARSLQLTTLNLLQTLNRRNIAALAFLFRLALSERHQNRGLRGCRLVGGERD